MNDGFVPGLLIGILVTGLLAALAMSMVNESWRYEAVKHGKAEFYLDAIHNRQWKWKEQP